MQCAAVLDLAASHAANRFTLRDRMELGRWSDAAQARNERLVLHERLDNDPPDVGNYVALYARDCCWASWGLSRRLGGIVVWDSITGQDSGRFASMHEALCWVFARRPGPPAMMQGTSPWGRAADARLAKGLVEGVGFEPT